MSDRTDTRKQPLQLVREIESEERGRRETRRRACDQCRDWADVIHGDYAGEVAEQWGRWPEPDHRCPICGREPEVVVLMVAFKAS